MVATFTSSDGKHLIGADEIAKAAVNEVVIDAGAGTKGIFVHALVNRRTVRGQTLTLKTAGEVVLAGAIVLDDDQTVSIDASGLDALGCVGNDPDKSNGSHIEGGQIHLAVGADGVGMSSRPKGQVVTNHVRYLELISVATAKVCLNMMSTGNDTMTMLLGTMNLGGQTLIRLDVQPVITTSGISMNGSGASLLIGPNASLCY